MNIGSLIKEKRISLHLSQAELARKINVNQMTIWRFENGYIPNPLNAKKLSETLNIPIKLLGGSLVGQKQPKTEFSIFIREARIKKYLTIRQLAIMIGINPGSMKDYDNGKNQPSKIKVVRELAEVLEIQLKKLLDCWNPGKEEREQYGEYLKCVTCKEIKHTHNFHKDASQNSGYNARCKECREKQRQRKNEGNRK